MPPICQSCVDLQAEVTRLRELLQPFMMAAQGIPDNWPDECVLDWREADDKVNGGKYAYIGYLPSTAQGGPTIKQYRAVETHFKASP